MARVASSRRGRTKCPSRRVIEWMQDACILGPGATIETRLEALEKNVTVMIDESITKRIEELFRKNADAVSMKSSQGERMTPQF